MTQYSKMMREKRTELDAEEWGNRVTDIHCFDTTKTTLWYETRSGDGRVMDIRYNNGRIKRTLPSGKTIWITGQLSKKTILGTFSAVMEDIRHGLR